MSTTSTLTVTHIGRVALLQFIRPHKMNAFSSQQYADTISAFKSLADNDGVSCLVITGSGPMFTSGHDLGESFFTAPPSKDASAPPARGPAMVFLSAIQAFPKPIICAVNGGAVGIGVTLTLLSDITICSTDAWFHTPFLNLGLCPEGGSTLTFPRSMGSSWAGALLYAGERISAADAASSGLVYRCVEPEELLPAALNLAGKVAAQPLESLLTAKRLFKAVDGAAVSETVEREGAEFARRLQEPDFAKALSAFKGRKSKGTAAAPAAAASGVKAVEAAEGLTAKL